MGKVAYTSIFLMKLPVVDNTLYNPPNVSVLQIHLCHKLRDPILQGTAKKIVLNVPLVPGVDLRLAYITTDPSVHWLMCFVKLQTIFLRLTLDFSCVTNFSMTFFQFVSSLHFVSLESS